MCKKPDDNFQASDVYCHGAIHISMQRTIKSILRLYTCRYNLHWYSPRLPRRKLQKNIREYFFFATPGSVQQTICSHSQLPSSARISTCLRPLSQSTTSHRHQKHMKITKITRSSAVCTCPDETSNIRRYRNSAPRILRRHAALPGCCRARCVDDRSHKATTCKLHR